MLRKLNPFGAKTELEIPEKNQIVRGEQRRQGVPMRLPLLLVAYLLLTLGGYIGYKAREAIPSRYSLDRPAVSFNEGGERCFDAHSAWHSLSLLSSLPLNSSNIKDVFELGGTTPKNILRYDEHPSKLIWKPQIPRHNNSKHYDSSFNEVIYFHFDCLLNLRRTPPARSFILPYTPFFESLTEQSKRNYDERAVDWELWRSSLEVPGVAQVYAEGVQHVDILVEYGWGTMKKIAKYVGLDKRLDWLLGATDATIREYAQRDMIDFILGNWDRLHNQFYVKEPDAHGNMETKLIYLDHNHLKQSAVLPTFKLTHCKFWYSTIERVREVQQKGITELLHKSLAREEIKEYALANNLDAPLLYAGRRAVLFLNHVDKCIADHGFHSVFGFPHSPSFLTSFSPNQILPFP